MVDLLDVLDLVKAQIERSKVYEVLQPSDVGDKVIVQIEIVQGRGERREALNLCDDILAETEALELCETVEF